MEISFIAACTAMSSLIIAAELLYGGPADIHVLMLLRIPRIATAMIAGAALSLSGIQMQSSLRNPIADPHIMGISSGASLGAALAAMYGGFAAGGNTHELSMASAAFIGAASGSAVIMSVSKKARSASVLLVFGVMMGFMANAVISAMQFRTDAESLKLFSSWSSGSFSYATWPQISVMTAALAIAHVTSRFNSKGLDIILFGDGFAQACGADPRRIRLWAMFSCCIATGTVTAFCGPIGFVGIIAPHITRSILGTSSHRSVATCSMACGATICAAADLMSQPAWSQLPISSTMAFIGVPMTFYILMKKTEHTAL